MLHYGIITNFAAEFRITSIMKSRFTVILYCSILSVVVFLVFYLSCVPDVMTASRNSGHGSRAVVLGRPFEAKDVQAGNYSGMVRLGGNRYALVADKADRGGYFIINIDNDEMGNITSVASRGFRQLETENLDEAAIAYDKDNHNIYIGSEETSEIIR